MKRSGSIVVLHRGIVNAPRHEVGVDGEAARPMWQTQLVACLIMPAATWPAMAREHFWNNPAGGSFAVSSNWTPPGHGGIEDNIHFNLGVSPANRYTVTGVNGENDRMLVHTDSVKLHITNYLLRGDGSSANSIVIGENNGDRADVILTGSSGSSLSTAFTAVSIGELPGSIGIATVDNLPFTPTTLLIGTAGSGTLNIVNGSAVSTFRALVGVQSGSNGSVTVEGAASRLHSDGIVIGVGGSGMLSVTSGATVTSFDVVVGEAVGSSGRVILSGGSTWTNSSDTTVGQLGSAELLISGGADMSNTMGIIARYHGGTGMVTVDGNGSTWNNSSSLRVGWGGSGAMMISGGGAVSSSNGSIGFDASGDGSVTVSGPGSAWTISGRLGIGGDAISLIGGGKGTLTIGTGGKVTASSNTSVFSKGTLNLNGGALETVLLSNRGGIVQLGGALTATGGVENLAGGLLKGSGSISGNLTNSGRITPGFSPGIINIGGNYTQLADGILEIEVGGTTVEPVVLHDQLRVTGTASLSGRLEVPIINGFVPAVDNTVDFLIAGSRVGTFNATVSSGLPSNRALTIEYGATGARLRFINSLDEIKFDRADNQPADWFSLQTWKNTSDPTMDRVPDNRDNIVLQSLPMASQQVKIDGRTPTVNSLNVGGGTGGFTLNIGTGDPMTAPNLISTRGVTIESQGVVALNVGTVTTSTIQIEGGGVLKGNGIVAGNLVVGGSAGSANGVVRPGLSVGRVAVLGNYQQGSHGMLEMEVDGTGNGLFDTLGVSGSAQLGGTVQIDASDLTTFTPGAAIPIITATNLSGTFDAVETVGNDGVYFVLHYESGGVGSGLGLATVYAEPWQEGNMIRVPGPLDSQQNLDAFAWPS